METIRICKDKNVLGEYLAQREKEVITIMMSLFDEEQIMKSFIRSERHDADRETAERMIKDGEMPLEKIARYIPSLSMEELKQIEAECDLKGVPNSICSKPMSTIQKGTENGTVFDPDYRR